MTSKPGPGVCPGMSQTGACLLVWRCPAYRWRELGIRLQHGTGEGPALGVTPAGCGGWREGEPQAVKSRERESTGHRAGKSGRLIVVMKLL